jgi:hypothetical protein
MPETMTAGRRTLSFARLDDVMPDVDRLLLGHTTVGKWSLGQMCRHLCWSVTHSIEGYSEQAPWIVRVTLGRFALRGLLSSERIAEGFKTPTSMVPKPGLDARAEAEALRAALRLFAVHNGPMALHPFFGTMTRDQWELLHRIHCAHHLSFAVPEAS